MWFFRPIAVFNLGFFRSDDLVIWTVYAILAREDSNFFLDFMVLSNGNTLFEKDYCTKKSHFFICRKIDPPSDRASYTLFQSPTSIALAHENPSLHLVANFWKNRFFRKWVIFGYKQFITRKAVCCRGARVCARQMLLSQSTLIYIVSIPHLDCPSARES